MKEPAENQGYRIPWYRITLYYGLFFVFALAFAWLGREVTEQETLGMDTAVLRAIHGLANPTLDQATLFITSLGGPVAIPIGAALLLGFFWIRKERWNAIYVALTLGGTFLLNTALKLFFRRDRPSLWSLLVEESSYSFPSGHAMISMALGLTLVILTFYSRGRWAVIVLSALYVLAIGFTRMYLGVHYPTDIIGGWLMSLVWVFLATRFMMRNTDFRQDTLS